jgi:large subunit ribosomal protein L15
MLNKFTKGNRKKEMRVGRGGKRGTTSGRGTKGQRSRSGHRIRPAERDLIIRIPKRRGFRNKIKSDLVTVLNLSDIKGKLKTMIQEEKGHVLSFDVLKEAKAIPQDFRGPIKLLGGGSIDFAVNVRGIEVSGSAKAKIEKAGGKVETKAVAK